MQTPIADFVKEYANKNGSRFHMPGHKGQAFLGCEAFDITEVAGADALYEACGIIAESEQNATELFGTGKTIFSTEGSSQCIRAMLYLAVSHWSDQYVQTTAASKKPYVIAARNAHKAFLYATALIDFDVVWLYPEEMHSLCSCHISPEQLEKELIHQLDIHGMPPAAVYVTSPDYLGGQLAMKELASICHNHNTILAADNAHGSYLHFLEKPMHPIDLGADICCDSAHKTLPVLTGGAYLQISSQAPKVFCEQAKHAMALFGSTSPSYLILTSLDLCNRYLAEGYEKKLSAAVKAAERLRKALDENGWKTLETDPLKITIQAPKEMTGYELAKRLRLARVECEYADSEYMVLMATPENTEKDYKRVLQALGTNNREYGKTVHLKPAKSIEKLTIREAIFAPHELLPVKEALGRICGSPAVGCPPAIPVVVSGELIDKNAIALFEHYGITMVEAVKSFI